MTARALLIALLTLCASARGATYYVATNGNNGAAGTLAAPWATPTYAASSMQANDVLFIRGGLYNAGGNDGVTLKSGCVISNYPGECPVIAGTYRGAVFDGVVGAKVFGLVFPSPLSEGAHIDGSYFCQLACTTITNSADGIGGYERIKIEGNSASNTVGPFNVLAHGAHELLWIGRECGSVPCTNYLGIYNGWCPANLIVSNTIYSGRHAAVTIYAPFTMVIGNYIHNEPWQWSEAATNYGSGRCIGIDPSGYGSVIDGNIIAYAGYSFLDVDSPQSARGIECAAHNVIIRNNEVRFTEATGIIANYSKGYAEHIYATNSHVYHNTVVGVVCGPNGFFWANGTFKEVESAVLWEHWYNATTEPVINTAWKNNLLHRGKSVSYTAPVTPFTYNVVTNGLTISSEIFEGNWLGHTNDPLFVDETAGGLTYTQLDGVVVPGNPTNPASINLRLQTNSPCIDKGVWLTTCVANGSGTSIPVADAYYFYNGLGVTDGDQIQLQGSTNRARITAVNYGTATLTLDTSLTWTNGQGVALAYEGNAPDVGAYESGVTGAPEATNIPPSIVSQPASQTNYYGSNATFTVTASGGGTLAYQWIFGATNIGGATASAYTRSACTTNDAGSYTVVVTNEYGGVTSSVAALILTAWAPPPTNLFGLSFAATNGTMTAGSSSETWDITTSDGGYISQNSQTAASAGDGGQAVYWFNVTNAGTYSCTMRVDCPTDSANSVFFTVDTNAASPSNVADFDVTTGFSNCAVSCRGAISNGVATVWTLSSGSHKLTLGGREAGAKVQTVTFALVPAPVETNSPKGLPCELQVRYEPAHPRTLTALHSPKGAEQVPTVVIVPSTATITWRTNTNGLSPSKRFCGLQASPALRPAVWTEVWRGPLAPISTAILTRRPGVEYYRAFTGTL